MPARSEYAKSNAVTNVQINRFSSSSCQVTDIQTFAECNCKTTWCSSQTTSSYQDAEMLAVRDLFST